MNCKVEISWNLLDHIIGEILGDVIYVANQIPME